LETIARAPENIPAAPAPATALPTISMSDEVAVAHNKLPISKIAMKVRYPHFNEKYLNSFPVKGCRVQLGGELA
jgi:hypothetical protein